MTTLAGTMLVADDVRYEHNGKLIIVGAYTTDISIPVEPLLVPNMVLLFSMEAERSERPASISFDVTLPGDQTKSLKIPLRWSDGPIPEIYKDRRRWTIKVPFVLGSVSLRTGPIEARAYFDENNSVRLTRFWIQHVPQPIPQSQVTTASSAH